jgi:hypothetical protein
VENVPIPRGHFKASSADPQWVKITDGRVSHSFEFYSGEEFPWLRPLLWGFEGWRLMRSGKDLLIVPEDKPWGIA